MKIWNRAAVVAGTLAMLAGAATVAGAQPAAGADAELVGSLSKELGVTADQARGGAGALFGIAKQRMDPKSFEQVAQHVPGMDGLLKAAPALGNVGDMGKLGTLAAAAGAFKKLGLDAGMVSKFIPALTKFVGAKGGGGVANLLAGALK
jgi:hypothetical protein